MVAETASAVAGYWLTLSLCSSGSTTRFASFGSDVPVVQVIVLCVKYVIETRGGGAVAAVVNHCATLWRLNAAQPGVGGIGGIAVLATFLHLRESRDVGLE